MKSLLFPKKIQTYLFYSVFKKGGTLVGLVPRESTQRVYDGLPFFTGLCEILRVGWG
jgi:hypothetical protein